MKEINLKAVNVNRKKVKSISNSYGTKYEAYDLHLDDVVGDFADTDMGRDDDLIDKGDKGNPR